MTDSSVTTGQMPDGESRRARWMREGASGALGAIVAFSIAIPVGTVALAPLGPAYAGLGAVAGIISATVGSLVAGLAGANPMLRSGPMTAMALVMSAVLSATLALPAMSAQHGVSRALAFALASIALAGVIQLGMGFGRLGQAIKFTPRPVLAGFRNGVAILILISQVPAVLGMAHPFWAYDRIAFFNTWLPWTMVVVASGACASIAIRRLAWPTLAPLGGILCATAVHAGLGAIVGYDRVGSLVGTLPSLLEVPDVLNWVPEVMNVPLDQWPFIPVVTGAVSMALIGAVVSLMASKAMQDDPFSRSDTNRELRAQGLGNLASAAAGGVPTAGAITVSDAIHAVGGRARLATVVAVAFQVVAVVALTPWIAQVPLAALASVMIVFGWDTFDRETIALIRDLGDRRTLRSDRLQDLAIIFVVVAASVIFNVVVGVLTGIVIAMIQFSVKSSVAIVRRHATGATRHSLHQRSVFETTRLRRAGHQIAVFELQGAIFFGTAERLADDIHSAAAGVRFVVLDLLRVTTIDATGAHLLRELRANFAERGGDLLLASVPENDVRRKAVVRGLEAEEIRWFPDADRALEWCEAQVLAEQTLDTTFVNELPFKRLDLCADLEPDDIKSLLSHAVRSTHPAATELFQEGEAGNAIYMLAHGRVSMMLQRRDGLPAKRVATFAPGVTFGEIAFLQDRARTATARCDKDVVVWTISAQAVDAMIIHEPHLAAKLYRAIGRYLAARLRETTLELRDFSDP